MKKLIIITAILFSVSAFSQEMKVHKTNGNVESFLLSQIDSITFTSSTIPTDMIAYYPFNGNANDESGNGNNGTVNGATLTLDRFGNANSAYSFDGVNDFIEIINSLPDMQSATISVWLNIAELSGTGTCRTVFFDGTPTLSKDFYFMLNQGSNNFYTKDDNNLAFNNTLINPYLNTWIHIVFLADADNNVKKVLLNNSVIAINNSWTGEANIGYHYKFQIGHTRDNPSQSLYFFKGGIDDIRIYNHALTDAEILDLYHEGGWE
jgi:hypothetical protein